MMIAVIRYMSKYFKLLIWRKFQTLADPVSEGVIETLNDIS